eukprot:1394504-Amphidinium_carterae.1
MARGSARVLIALVLAGLLFHFGQEVFVAPPAKDAMHRRRPTVESIMISGFLAAEPAWAETS